ncbi:hypothetical protein [Veillonella sp. oral taxon 780]|uniref:hypothetical protein n=1 Tax=Veillonella sp. oral taxon 780 TaxID=671229 RepID=UPI00021A2122|nr:hypothetical protein [Veillonella sp. oral taxon 780]EGS37160.1 hypothetical protein HMPREF9200_1125 [Veillonella sp. oral taxon 780 str. F0422]
MVAKDNKLVEDVTIEAEFTQINQMEQYFYGDKEKLVDSNSQKIVEFFFNSTGKIQVKKIRGVESPQTTCNFGTQASASNALATLFELDEPPFSLQKPIEILLDFTRRFTSDDDIILDFFSRFRVIIMSQANNRVNTRVLELLPKFKIKKINCWGAI